MEWVAAILGLVGVIGGIASSIASYSSNKQANDIAQSANLHNLALNQNNLKFQQNTADKNFGLQERQYNDQLNYNNLLMQREDNAIQRQVADLKAAGLSPLMVSGGSPASALSTASAPQYDATGVSNAFAGVGNALNGLFKTKAEKEQIRGALKANVISALSNAPINTMQNYYQAKELKMKNDILQAESTYYNEHGFKPTSFRELLSDFIKGINGNEIATPGLSYDFGKNIRNKAQTFVEENPFSLPDYLTKNSKEPTSEVKTTSYYQNSKQPSIALRDTKMNKIQVANLVRMWALPHSDKNMIKWSKTLSDYYDLMPNLAKNNISKKDFISGFKSRNVFTRKLLFGSN